MDQTGRKVGRSQATVYDGEESVPPARISVLGGFRVERRGEEIPDAAWVRPQTRQLVKILAVERTHRLHREQLIDSLWPEAEPVAGHANLRKLIHYARRALDDQEAAASIIVTHGDSVGLDPSVEIDADAFEAIARRGLNDESPADLELALAVYHGDVLPDDVYEPWAESRRSDLAALRRRVLETLAVTLEGDRPNEAAERYRMLLDVDPADETAHRALMRLYARLGRTQRALEQYRLCRDALAEYVGAEPSEETERLREAIRIGVANRENKAPSVALPAAARKLSRMPLVGRERALEIVIGDPALQRMGERLDADARRPLVLVGGEAGVGKTRLAAEVARVAAGRGAQVLWGSCSRVDAGIAYGPFVDAFERYIGTAPESERDALTQVAPELGRILPSVPSEAIGGSDPRSEQARLFAAAVRGLDRIAGRGPLLLILDDAHQADEGSLTLVHYLARAAAQRPWIILATYRTHDSLPNGLGSLERDLHAAGLERKIDLLPLGRGNCSTLVELLLEGGQVPAEVQENLYRLSQGNPLYVTELVRALRRSDRLVLAAGCWRFTGDVGMVPPRVADLITQHIESLGDGARRCLNLAAAAGAVIETDWLLAAGRLAYSEQAAIELIDAIEAALDARVLEERSGELAFRHPLFEESIYGRLSDARRRHLHGALARALEERRPVDVESLAYHFGRSDDQGKAIVYLERAGDRAAAVYANTLAEEHYRTLTALLEQHDRRQDRARIQRKLGSLLVHTARYDEAQDALTVATELCRQEGNAEGLALVAAAFSTVHINRGSLDDGLSLVDEALTGAGAISALAQAKLHLARASLAQAKGELGRSIEATMRVEDLIGAGETREERATLVDARSTRAWSLVLRGEIARAREILLLAVRDSERAGNLHVLGDALIQLAGADINLGLFDESREFMERAAAIMTELGNEAWAAFARAGLGGTYFLLGDWPAAATYIDGAIEQLRNLGEPPYAMAWALSWRAYLAIGEGDLSLARTMATESATIAERTRVLQHMNMGRIFLAYLDLAEGNPEAALKGLEVLIPENWDEDNGKPDDDLDADLVLGYAAWAWQDTGDPERAERASALAVRRARRRGSPRYLSNVFYPRATVLIAQRRLSEAECLLGEALALARSMGFPFGEMTFLTLQGQVAAARGEDAKARRLSEEAAAIRGRLGNGRIAMNTIATPAL